VFLTSVIRNALGFVKRAIAYRSFGTAALIQTNLPNIVAPLRPDGGRIVIDELGLSLDPTRHSYYLPQLSGVRDLVKVAGGSFVVNQAGDPEYCIGNLRLVPQNRDDLYVLTEVFGKQLYELHDGREWFAVDVGMNVGYAALYFAGILGWETVAYEPFSNTFDLAVQNIERNGLSHRVHPRKAGVGGKDEKITVGFDADARSTNSVFGNLQHDRSGREVPIEIQLVDAASAIGEALEIAGDRPLLLKLDCEGSEYDIVDRLAETGLLDQVEAYIIEYHYIRPEDGPERIRAPFLAHGFLVKTIWSGIEAGGILALRGPKSPPTSVA